MPKQVVTEASGTNASDTKANHPKSGGSDPVGGPLFVSSPGTYGVATDALTAHGERLARMRDLLIYDGRRLRDLPPLSTATSSAAARSEVHLDEGISAVDAAAGLATRLHASLMAAIESYTHAEQKARDRALYLTQTLAGFIGPFIGPLVPSGLITAGALAVVLSDPARQRQLGQWLMAHPEIYTSPLFVETVRMSVMSADDLVGGAMRLPPGAMSVLLAAAGFAGVQGGAALVTGGARQFGLLQDTDVRTTQRSSTTTAATANSAAVGVGQRLDRVPEGDQVRIERFDAPGEESRYVVYVGPTETFTPTLTSEPWDLSSNVRGVAGMDAASVRATEQAMVQAGIGADSPVQLVGFSQGGLVAARLAGSGEWHAVGLETHGAPTGNITLPDGISGLAIRNTDDFVPALAGPQLDHHLTQIERRAFPPGADIPTDQAAPAHQRDAYISTAAAVDAAESDAVRRQIDAMNAFTHDYTTREGATVTVTTYHAERIP